MFLFHLLIFILGTIIGSFLNVVIFRLKTNETILKNRSHCNYCQKKLNWYELIPLISFIIQLGKCRKCKKKISWQYALVELSTGLILVKSMPTTKFNLDQKSLPVAQMNLGLCISVFTGYIFIPIKVFCSFSRSTESRLPDPSILSLFRFTEPKAKPAKG